MLQATAVSKSFFSNKVLDSVDFDVRKGEVHGLVGENGAGKSTLINIIGGILQRDFVQILFDGREVNFTHPLEAMGAGISVVHQELSLVPNATVSENIFLRREKLNALGLNDWPAMTLAAAQVFKRMGIDVDPKALAGSLSVGMQQLVEVAKAISFEAKLLIMDEPTSSLSEKEIDELSKVIRDLRNQGLAIIFVSHKLSELFNIADRVTVLRDGRLVATTETSSLTTDDLIRMMVGRQIGTLYPPRASTIGDVVFSCQNVSRFGAVRDVAFDVRRGEIFRIGGSRRGWTNRSHARADQRRQPIIGALLARRRRNTDRRPGRRSRSGNRLSVRRPKDQRTVSHLQHRREHWRFDAQSICRPTWLRPFFRASSTQSGIHRQNGHSSFG